MRWFLIAIMGLMLTGCWVGVNLFSDSDARPIIPPGVYRSHSAGEGDRQVRVSLTAEGLTQVRDLEGGDGDIFGIAAIQGDGARYVGWASKEDEGKQVQMYFLIEKLGPSSFALTLPECRGADQSTARAVGATVESGNDGACIFHSRDQVQRAMANFRPTGSERMTLVRLR